MLAVKAGVLWPPCVMFLRAASAEGFRFRGDHLNDKYQLSLHIWRPKLFSSTKRVITHANSPRFHFFLWVPPALESAGARLPGISDFKVNHSEKI